MADDIGRFADVFKLLGDRTRLTILAALRDRELCVCEIVEYLQTSQPNVSQHMRKLKAGGLVKESKRGQWVYYSLNLEAGGYLQEILNSLPAREIERMKSVACIDSNCCE